MAKMKLSENKFKMIAEGTHTFKVMEVNDKKYESFGKLTVKLQTAKGETHIESFSFLKNNGDINEGALKAWSYFARTCLNNYRADEIDTQDIVGCYIAATVKHEPFTRTKGENAGTEGVAVRLNDYTPATGFADKSVSAAETDDLEDMDDFLND